jgi:hypothetical protein
MEPVTLTTLREFLRRLGERFGGQGDLYLLGGSALCLLGNPRTEAEVREALDDALGIPELERLLEDTVEERRQELVAERERMRRRALRKQMEQQKGSQPAEWLEGIDDLAPGSLDLLTVTVLFPV